MEILDAAIFSTLVCLTVVCAGWVVRIGMDLMNQAWKE